jgi:peptide/nickel transport system substrate-binding protein
LFAIFVALSLIAAACGGGDDSDGDADSDDGESTETADEDSSDDSGDSTETDDADTAAEDEPEATEDEMVEPLYGGDLTMLVEAITATWDIPDATCVTSCMTVMRAVADPMTIVNEAGDIEPFVLAGFEANEDFTSFTLTMRENVTFHDGTVADGAAVMRNLTEMKQGLLHSQVLADMDPEMTLIDDMTVQVDFALPTAVFGHYISERTGYLIAPSFWDDPDRAGKPVIATGPFEMVEWTIGEQTVLRRYDNYWRTDGEGRQLPYLDSITVRPIEDVSTRRATMEAGDADVNHDSFGENKDFWLGEWTDDGGGVFTGPVDKETTYLLLNNAEGSPFADPALRRAIALCTDLEEYKLLRSPGNDIANGPFAPGTLGYLEDTGYPQFDADAGNAILDEIGRPDTIIYGTTNVPSNLITATLIADMWSRNCGLNVVIDQFDQAQLVTIAITGDFEVFLWRNHGQIHPGNEGLWWHSRNATGIALNFGRIVDTDLDALLEAAWATEDQAELDSLGQQMNQIFGTQVYNIWLNWTEWNNPYQANVHGVDHVSLPSGGVARASVAGRMFLGEVWKS